MARRRRAPRPVEPARERHARPGVHRLCYVCGAGPLPGTLVCEDCRPDVAENIREHGHPPVKRQDGR